MSPQPQPYGGQLEEMSEALEKGMDESNSHNPKQEELKVMKPQTKATDKEEDERSKVETKNVCPAEADP